MTRSIHRRLLAFTTIAGIVFIGITSKCPTLTYTQIYNIVPFTFYERHGFFQVLRWLEHVHQPDDMNRFLKALESFGAASSDNRDISNKGFPLNSDAFSSIHTNTIEFRSSRQLVKYLSSIVSWETYMNASKMCLQWSLLLFLLRARSLSKHCALLSVASCVVQFVLSKITLNILVDMLSSIQKEQINVRSITTLLALLYFARYTFIAILSLVFARGYQQYFGNFPTKWKQIPAYLGSTRFALPTLFFTIASVSIMAMSTTTLRSLSEAVFQIENVALTAAFGHFAYIHYFAQPQLQSHEKLE